MNHNGIDTGILRASIDGEIDAAQAAEVSEHVAACAECHAELASLQANAAGVRERLDRLPLAANGNTAVAWAKFQTQTLPAEIKRSFWNVRRGWSLAGAGVFVAVVALLFTLAPVRSWAQNFLAIFRVERFTVLELNPDAMKTKGLDNDQFFNQNVSRMLSDEVNVTEPPRLPEPVADAATASRRAGFPVELLAGETPSSLLFRSSIGAQMKLDRDRMQSILDEAGRDDIQIPESVDGATIGLHVPAGIVALYGNCGDTAAHMQGKAEEHNDPPQRGDDTCVSLMELRSPTVSAPKQVDPAQIAQVALQFIGMSANDAASFTQTVDWTTTLVLPVMQGQSNYKKVAVNGNEGVLLRPKGSQSGHYSLLWVDNRVVYDLSGIGDDTTALNLAAHLE